MYLIINSVTLLEIQYCSSGHNSYLTCEKSVIKDCSLCKIPYLKFEYSKFLSLKSISDIWERIEIRKYTIIRSF